MTNPTRPVRLKLDLTSGDWLLICDLCGLRERYRNFWRANQSCQGHRDMHAAA
jgi:hypothetical protein